MRFSLFAILAAGASTAAASPRARDIIGTVDVFTNRECSQGGKNLDITGKVGRWFYLKQNDWAVESHVVDDCYCEHSRHDSGEA